MDSMHSMHSMHSTLIKESENENKVLIGKRSHLYRRLSKIRDILPGAFSIRKVLCGKVNCACKKGETSYCLSVFVQNW